MRRWFLILIIAISGIAGCTSQQKLSYLNNLPESAEPQYFPYERLDYRVQPRDILYVDVKTQTSEGKLESALQANINMSMNLTQGESGGYLMGYNIDKEGNILLPVIGKISVGGKTLPEIRSIIQLKVDSVFNHAYVDVKLLSFKYTVLGEARSPGAYVNYNDYLTVLEAVGRAGGVGDYGRRDRILVVRSTPDGSKTYRVNLQDKNLLSSEAYFLQPNDLVIIEPMSQKIFNLNLPTISFIVSTITGVLTTTLLLINYFGK